MELMNETEHQHYEVSGRNLGFAILLNIGITLAQSIGGIISGSMALLSDAAHNFSDVLSMIISFLANRLAKREATEKQTFGFRRSEILAAFINSATLILISGIIIFEAIQRLVNPVPISANLVICLAIAGILVNGVSVLFIRNDSHENMNIKSVYLHLFGDMLGFNCSFAGRTCNEIPAMVPDRQLLLYNNSHLFALYGLGNCQIITTYNYAIHSGRN